MTYSIEEYTRILKQKTSFWLVDNATHFSQDDLNPFDKNQVPLMCDFVGDYDFPSFEAYESGNRSILFMNNGTWFKAKGIGIPVGVSRPIFDNDKIFTYLLLDDPNMCHRSILWGFMQKEEFKCELYGAEAAKKLGQNIELIGTACFDNVYCIQVKDRQELFKKLRNINRDNLIGRLKKDGRRTTAYSVYYNVPSDIRVGELFYVFMFPKITKLIDPKLIKEYVEWLGSSCGYLLRTFHDSGVLHGTWVSNWATSLGLKDVHSNSYTGNFLVDDEGLTMCDFDLSKPIENESMKEIEKWALVHVENPLYYAGSYLPSDALNQGIAKRNPFREELAGLFEKAVDLGYGGEPADIEKKLKKEMLDLLVKAKGLMWKLYELPQDLTGVIYYLDYVISTKKIRDKEFREAAFDFWN